MSERRRVNDSEAVPMDAYTSDAVLGLADRIAYAQPFYKRDRRYRMEKCSLAQRQMNECIREQGINVFMHSTKCEHEAHEVSQCRIEDWSRRRLVLLASQKAQLLEQAKSEQASK